MTTSARVAPTIRRIGLPMPYIVGAGLAPALEHLHFDRDVAQLFHCHIGRRDLTLHGEFALVNQT
jgi:hypothetical protein